MNILEKENKTVFLLGNEAIVRGALEAGVQFVSTYPGTPASEIGNNFWEISQKVPGSKFFTPTPKFGVGANRKGRPKVPFSF